MKRANNETEREQFFMILQFMLKIKKMNGYQNSWQGVKGTLLEWRF